MDIFLNEKVTHKKFGEGSITESNFTEANDGYLNVRFEQFEGLKSFKYPDAFDNFVTFNTNSFQLEATRLIENVKAKELVKKELKKMEFQKIEEEQRLAKRAKVKRTANTAAAKLEKLKAEANALKAANALQAEADAADEIADEAETLQVETDAADEITDEAETAVDAVQEATTKV